ncbi:MAG: LCP family protein [Elusimicrobiota bacterium]
MIIFGGFFYKAGFTFSKIIEIKNITWDKIFGERLPLSEYTPLKDENRLNFLLLGIRGIGDDNGGMLADSIMVVSYQKSTGQIALISLPRDLYLKMPGEKFYEKINSAYVLGENLYGNGLDYSKKTVGFVTGLYIDHAVAVNFQAFESAIDILGGVTIHLEQPFVEDKQWWCDEDGKNCKKFVIPAGEQTLDGETALLYVRSRFSSNDFDRARRQQQILVAVKDKLLSLNALTNPKIINNLFNVVADNVKIDTMPWEFPSLIKLATKANTENIIRKVFGISENGLLKEAQKDGIYILLPKQDNFSEIREACQQIFEL